MGNATSPKTFSEKLDAALAAHDVGVRTVARRIVARRGVPAEGDIAKRVDNVRRQLNKYRGGVVPTAPSRHEVEDALDLERDELKPDDDDEADPAVRRMTIDDLLRARISEIVAESLSVALAGERES